MNDYRMDPPDALLDLVLLTVADVARVMHITPKSVYQLQNRGELPYLHVKRPGNRRRRMTPAWAIRRWQQARMVDVMGEFAA